MEENFSFLDKSEAELQISNDRDQPFFNNLSEKEMIYRAGNIFTKQSTIQEKQEIFLNFIKKTVLNWTKKEKEIITKCISKSILYVQNISSKLVPTHINLIKTNGKDEGSAFYTRNLSIIIPLAQINKLKRLPSKKWFKEILCHEMWHIISRYNLTLKTSLYSCLGFSKIENLEMGEYLKERKITNPDAIDLNWMIEFEKSLTISIPEENSKTKNGKEKLKKIKYNKAVLVDYCPTDKLVANKSIVNYIESHLFPIENIGNDNWIIVDSENGKRPPFMDPLKVIEFMQKTRNNTFYISHPEEILADNISILAMFFANYDIDEIDEKGRELLRDISVIFEKQDKFDELEKNVKKKYGVSSRQKRNLKQGSIDSAERKRKKIS